MEQVTSLSNNPVKSPFNLRKLFNGIFMYIAIGLSGILFFVSRNYQLTFTIILFSMFIIAKKKIIVRSLNFLLFVLFIFLLQSLKYNTFSTIDFITILVKFGLAIIVLSYFRSNFVRYYTEIIYYIAVVSLIIYFARLIIPGVDSFLYQVAHFFNIKSGNDFYIYKPSFILYTLHEKTRNSGPFWEPGAYGIFLMIALVFEFFKNKDLLTKKSLVFIVSIITTLSTTSILGLFVFLLTISVRRWWATILFIPVLLVMFNFVYYTYGEVFSSKIDLRLEISQKQNYYKYSPNRITSFLMDLDDVKRNPFLGEGRSMAVRGIMNQRFSLSDHRNNGISNIAVRFGLLYFIIFYIMLFKSIKAIANYYKITNLVIISGSFITVVIMTSSEIIAEKVIILVLAQLFLVFKPNTLKIER